jgi:hypothetical protein
MMGLMTDLDFICFHCENSMSVTLRCEGKGLMTEECPRAAVNVPCPHCGGINHVVFEPKGTLCLVSEFQNPFRQWEPSLN